MRVKLSESLSNPEEIVKELKSSSDRVGAICVFLGVVRSTSPLGRVVRLEYEAHEKLAPEVLRKILEEACRKHGLIDGVIEHKVGKAPVGETVMCVAVASEHREEAFKAVREIVERIKSEAPIWKKEVAERGERWVEHERLRVRKPSEEDAEDVAECSAAVWESLRGLLPDEWVEEEAELSRSREFVERVREAVGSPDAIILLAELDGEVVGVAYGRYHKGGSAHLGFIGVKPDHRQRGIGTALLRAFLEEAKNRGARKVWLHTHPNLKEAVRMYVREGFTPEGYLRKHMYGQDLIIYSKLL